MATWIVAHVIHVRTPHDYIPRLVITGVPAEARVTWDALERAGFLFGEFGIPRANHILTRLSPETPARLIGRIRAGEGVRLSWQALQQRCVVGEAEDEP